MRRAYITDNTGARITVTNIDAAIKQAETYTGYYHQDKTFRAFDNERQDYWKDILTKLQTFKDKQKEEL